MRLLANAVLGGVLLALSFALPASAQAIFPNQGAIGLVPPPGMSEIPGVAGFEDRTAKAAILMVEPPPGEFETILKSFTPQALQANGVTIEAKRDLDLANGQKAVLLTGYQSVGTVALKKWIMLAADKDQAAIVTVQFPEEASARYPDAAIEASLRSLTFRAPPSQEELLARLPFKIGNLEGYRVLRVLGGTALLLTKAAADAPEGDVLPYFIVGAARAEVREEDRESLAKRAIASVPGVKELRVERAGPLRINGQPGIEIIAQGVDMKSDKPVKIAQWIRFERNSYLRMVGVMPADSFDADFGGMRGLRDNVEMR